jgi:hypothetical protein
MKTARSLFSSLVVVVSTKLTATSDEWDFSSSVSEWFQVDQNAMFLSLHRCLTILVLA